MKSLVSFLIALSLLLSLFLNLMNNQLVLAQAGILKSTSQKKIHVKLFDDPKVYYITESGLKRHLLTPAVFNSYGNQWSDIIVIGQNELNRYEPCQLIRAVGDYKVYKIEDGVKRWIERADLFDYFGYQWSKICPVNQAEFEAYHTTDSISSGLSEKSVFPQTYILKAPDSRIETNQVEFKFNATNASSQNSKITYETFIEGYDKKWQKASAKNVRRATLPLASSFYVFSVRARNDKGFVDPTPATISFRVKVSPYYQQIKITKLKTKNKDYLQDYLILTNSKNKQGVNLTGWTIENKKTSFVIPLAVEQLNVLYQKFSPQPINLGYKQTVVISANFSSVGENFRTNQCVGYLDQNKKLNPGLPKNCPYPDQDSYAHLSLTCQKYIKKIPRCQVPNYQNNAVVSRDSECTNFLTQIYNYEACYRASVSGSNFFNDQWRIFLGANADLWDNQSDHFILRDQQGLIVDKISY